MSPDEQLTSLINRCEIIASCARRQHSSMSCTACFNSQHQMSVLVGVGPKVNQVKRPPLMTTRFQYQSDGVSQMYQGDGSMSHVWYLAEKGRGTHIQMHHGQWSYGYPPSKQNGRHV